MIRFYTQLIAFILFLLIGLPAGPVTAETERIKVTGSRIKRIDMEGVAAVDVISRADIDRSGVSTVSDLLRNQTISSQGTYRSKVNGENYTVEGVNLRGLGEENTLVLLDGHRIPDEGGQGIVDLSVIPLDAVERVEILRDSASAIYGSDAAGGVVNIITRRDFNGMSFSLRTSKPSEPGGEESRFGWIGGVSTGRLRLLTTLSYREKKPVAYKDREWTSNGTSYYAIPANVIPLAGDYSRKVVRHDNCPASSTGVGSGLDNVCFYDFAATSGLVPKTESFSLLNKFEYDLTRDLQFFMIGRAVRSTNTWNMAPNAGPYDLAANQHGPISGTLAEDGTAVTIDADVPVRLTYRAVPFGNRLFDEENTVMAATMGLRGTVQDEWDWEVSVGENRQKKYRLNPGGFFLKDYLIKAISGTLTDTAGNPVTYDPFTESPDSSIVAAASYEPQSIITTDLRSANAVVSGEVAQLAGGPLGLAVGASAFRHRFQFHNDPQVEIDNVAGRGLALSDQGSRDNNAVFVELVMPWGEGLETQLAGRYDQYSDFGNTLNPKFGFAWKPVERLLLRGNMATGFRAPDLKDLYRGGTPGYDDAVDALRCRTDGDCDTKIEILYQESGNRDLEEERSRSWNFGMVVQATDQISVGADYWYLKRTNMIQVPLLKDILQAEADGTLQGATVIRGAPATGETTGNVDEVFLSPQNVGTAEDAGLDLNLEVSQRLGAQRLGFHSRYSRRAYMRQSRSKGAPVEDVLGDWGKPKDRAMNTLTWSLAEHAVLLRHHFVGGHDNSKGDGKISSLGTWDMQYVLEHPFDGRLTLGALNLFDTAIPLDLGQRGDSRRRSELYGVNKRVLYTQITQKF